MIRSPSWEAVDLLLKIARDATKGLTVQERLDAITEPLSALIPSASVSAVAVRPDHGTFAAWFKNGSPENAVEYATRYREADAMVVHGKGALCRLSDVLPSQRFGADAFTGEFLWKQRLKHILGFCARLPGGTTFSFALHREVGTRDFSDVDVELLRRAAHDIGRAVFSSLLREHALRSAGAPEGRVLTVVTGADGRPVEGAADGAHLLARLTRDDPGLERWLREGHALPERGGDECVERERHVETAEGDLVRIRAFAFDGAIAAGQLVVLEVLVPGSPALAQAIASRAGLTPRERLVAAAAVEGLGSREIASRLGIAVVTVGCHLTRIYAKTGTAGRNELTAFFLTGGRGLRRAPRHHRP